ncbi:cytochrome P450 [Corynespora cassiicola Philippines]|uniref:Cytochrome P450 n=1 Tax=Corynespora cassiicola Philippines TaxID=1448308 RepID=A0A2T2NRD4_CORCC|nr:cytochrome P450 [Corynespora cassiicola Philippines]
MAFPASERTADTLSSLWSNLEGSIKLGLGAILTFLAVSVIQYAVACQRYNHQHAQTSTLQQPPIYPTLFPLTNIFHLLFNTQSLLERITTHNAHPTSTRLPLFPGTTLTLLQERPSITSLWHSSSVSSPINAFVFVLQHVFGMSEAALAPYRADDSGPFPRPHPKSGIEERNRVAYLVHRNMTTGMVGKGLGPARERLEGGVRRRVGEVLGGGSEDGWVEREDLLRFVYEIVGLAVIEALCGPLLLECNPTFVEDFWVYDAKVPFMARAVPRWVMPKAYRARETLLKQLKNWYTTARSRFKKEGLGSDGDSSAWGSEMMRERQEVLLKVDGQDDASVAAIDLGFIWASVSNVLNATTWATLHMFQDQGLLQQVRSSLDNIIITDEASHEIPTASLEKDPLLSSIYAETLRFYGKSFLVVSSPHENIEVGGRWVLPKGEIGLVNSHCSHMDKTFWNTRNGKHPVDEFWAERFVQHPTDPDSGPVKPDLRSELKMEKNSEGGTRQEGPFFSLDGLDSAWIPYGGGYKKCPGRFLAKSAIMMTCALIAETFDLEIPANDVKTSPWKFGMGILRPKNAIPFRIRKRK